MFETVFCGMKTFTLSLTTDLLTCLLACQFTSQCFELFDCFCFFGGLNDFCSRKLFGTAASTQIASQAFSHIRTVRAFGTERKEVKRYDNALQEILERGLINALASTVTFALANYLDLGANALLLYLKNSSLRCITTPDDLKDAQNKNMQQKN